MTLLMRDQENIEKGIEKGKIYGAISAYKELGVADDQIIKKLHEKFQVTEKEAKEYLRESKE